MTETIESIAHWQYNTFGMGPVRQVFFRALEEIGELAKVIRDNPSDEKQIATETADVIITLTGILLTCQRLSAVDEKMAINREREWRSNGDGTGYHIKR